MTYEEALDVLMNKIQIDVNFTEDFNRDYDCLQKCKEALEKQTPKKPIWVEKIYEHHDWLKDDDGNIENCAWMFGYCNGPACKRCYKSFCVHCNSDNYKSLISEKCVCSHYECPTCHEEIAKGIKRCPNCGQAIDWRCKSE